MQKNESNKLDQKLIDKVIKVAYGDAGIADVAYIHMKAATSREIKDLLEEYKHTAKAVQNVKREEVPDHIIESVKICTVGKEQRESFASRSSNASFMFFAKRAIPATVLGIVLVLIVSFFVIKSPGPAHKYSKAEIELAEKQFRQSMVIVGEAFQNAEKSFSDEVLNKQVNKNLNRGYYLVNNILTGG
jgi:hypothetical protein